MHETALKIVDRFVNSPRAEERGKGFRALGHLGSAAAAGRLVDAALSDPDPDLRAEAEAILAREAEQPAVRDALLRRLDTPADRRRVYAMLGRLRLRGASLAFDLGGWWVRLVASLIVVDQFRRDMGWHFWVRGMRPCVLGAILGGIAGWQVFEALDLGASETFLLGFALSAVTFAIGVWSMPLRLHYDRAAALVSSTLVPAILAVGLTFWISSFESVASPFTLGIAALFVAVIRLAVALVSDGIPSVNMDAFITTLVAALFGLLVSAVAILLSVWVFTPTDSDAWMETWGLCWSFAFPLAALFTWLDRLPAKYRALVPNIPGPPRSVASARIGRATSICILSTSLLLAILGRPVQWDATGRMVSAALAPIEITGFDTAQIVELSRYSHAFEFKLGQRGDVQVEATRLESDHLSYRLEMEEMQKEQKGGSDSAVPGVARYRYGYTLLSADEAAASISTGVLEARSYKAHVSVSQIEVEGSYALPRLQKRIAYRLRLIAPPAYPIRLRFSLQRPARPAEPAAP
ncbi:hypothetical protein FG147_11065 [Thauera sp. UPWRP]|nr:hypothetical protein [Thauera sp.]TMW70778.1 hypothetical protein FG147_11065 [Thauera sp. UPWRP]